jgi:hypothetical protein
MATAGLGYDLNFMESVADTLIHSLIHLTSGPTPSSLGTLDKIIYCVLTLLVPVLGIFNLSNSEGQHRWESFSEPFDMLHKFTAKEIFKNWQSFRKALIL